ncbi:hypothetical protein [Sphingomonas oleivorans]|uniref:hypothetical protein n=1 Tax=Sphingomonas oleivorans TaxID=1735121 RepID=UPI0013FE3366|nr:hypothetical protein [Sphingomonas oleivorans]
MKLTPDLRCAAIDAIHRWEDYGESADMLADRLFNLFSNSILEQAQRPPKPIRRRLL